MTNSVMLLARALQFAADRHVDHRRKGKRSEPYLNHLAEVAHLLAQATNGEDPALVAAGLLHDTIEDTETSRAEIERAFGPDIATLVAEVTDDKSLEKQVRKQLQVETAERKSGRARMLKIADKISNVRSLAHSPPESWSRERKDEYFEWAAAVVAGCRGVNAWLDAAFDEAYEAGRAAMAQAEAD